jgi:uncharacterized metal-binding protein
MPSGHTHDRITWVCLPFITLAGFLLTQQLSLTLIIAIGFLFGGLMFGPDLDVRSRQSRRWGVLGWLWRPYRGWLRHRSVLSHGPIAGTLGRLLFLSLWAFLFTLIGLEFAHRMGWAAITWNQLGQAIGQNLWHHRGPWLALFIGLEAGAMSHSLSDWTVSSWKRATRPPRKSRPPRKPKRRAKR